jgi:hypothetical protein
MSWPNKVYSQSSRNGDFTADSTLVARWDGYVRNQLLIDAVGTRNLTVPAGVSSYRKFGNIVRRSANGIGFNAAYAYPTVNNVPVTAISLVRSQNAGFSEFIFNSYTGATAGWNLVYNPALGLQVERINYPDNARYVSGINILFNQQSLVLAQVNPAIPTMSLGVNGQIYTGVAGALFYGVGAGLSLGRQVASTFVFTGDIGRTAIYNDFKSAAWFRNEWVKVAQAAQLKTGWGAKVSIANESTVGNFVGNGSSPFEILSGTWKTSLQLVDGELHKVVECVAAGTVWLDRKFMNINSSEASYGSWRLSYGHAKDTVNVAHIGLTSTSKAAWDAASNTGYVLRLSATAAGDKLLRYSGGGAANLCFNMPNSSATTNQVQITRRFDNVWQGYQTPYIVAANALLTPPWAPSADGPFTDATYTTSAGMSFTFNPGDWVSLGTVRDTYALTKFLGEFDPREV